MFNSSNIEVIRADLEAAIAAVSRRHNIDLRVGTLSYDDVTFSCSIKATAATGVDAGRLRWEKDCYKFGMSKHAFGRIFTCDGHDYQICDIAPRARKYPVIAIRGTDGKKFTFAARFGRVVPSEIPSQIDLARLK